MRSGGLPVVDGRYRAGTRIGPPVESHVRVRPSAPDERPARDRLNLRASLPGHRDAAVGALDLTGDERRRFATRGRGTNGRRLRPRPPDRAAPSRSPRLWYCSSFSGTTLPSASVKLCVEKLVRIMPGAIALHADAVATDLGRKRLRQHRHRGLRHAVTRERRRGRVDRARRDVDDVARTLRDHVPDRSLASVEHALQVDREDAFEVFVGAHRRPSCCAGCRRCCP